MIQKSTIPGFQEQYFVCYAILLPSGCITLEKKLLDIWVVFNVWLCNRFMQNDKDSVANAWKPSEKLPYPKVM